MRILLVISLCLCLNRLSAQTDTRTYYDLIDPVISGEVAYDATAYIEKYWRLAGNPGFDSSIHYLARKLRQAGFTEEGGSESRLTYRIERRPLERPAWHPKDASLNISGDPTPLLEFNSNRNMIAVNSHPTPPGGVTAPVVRISDLGELGTTDVKGKIVYAEIHPYYLYRAAVIESGAIGILSYAMPDYLNPEENSSSIQFRSIPPNDTIPSWAIALSYEAKERLNAALVEGSLEATVMIATEFIESEELTLVAQARGNKFPDQELVVSAHVQEPGANDNASGAGVAMEIATGLAGMITRDKFSPERTITFLWGDEIISTRRYVEDRGSHIMWGISLDMVGENTAITGGTFLIEKMPDPSAIWTRGEDKHTEWGAGEVSEDDLFPHYLNDFVLNRFLDQAQRTQWVVETNPFEGGSDHVPFLRAGIPGVLFWHFTDQFYHTDQDRLDKVSKETLENVATATMNTVMLLANADTQLARAILEEIREAAIVRLEKESRLSVTAVKEGGDFSEQKKILEAWTDYYLKTADTVSDLTDTSLTDAIDNVKASIMDKSEAILGDLRSSR